MDDYYCNIEKISDKKNFKSNLKKNNVQNSDTLVVCPFFTFWPLCCLFFFDIRILDTPLASSDSKVKQNKETELGQHRCRKHTRV
jgi:hypothetical protein